MNVIEEIKEFFFKMSHKYCNIDMIYKYQYLYDTHIIEVSSDNFFKDSNYVEDEFKFSMKIMDDFGETVLFVSPEESLHVVEPKFIFSYTNGKVEISSENKVNFNQEKELSDKFVGVCNSEIKRCTNNDFNIGSLSLTNSICNISVDKRNDIYELHNNIDFPNFILAA